MVVEGSLMTTEVTADLEWKEDSSHDSGSGTEGVE